MSSQTYHRKEMEERIRKFDSACVAAVHHIGHLQEQARSFLAQLSCDPREFKHRFLQCSKQLDEFMYAITDFNLAASSLGPTTSITTDTYIPPHIQKQAHETLSNSNTPSPSNIQRLPANDRKPYKRENRMSHTKTENWRDRDINSNGRDFIKANGNVTVERNENLTDTGCQPVGLPPQPKLDPATKEATIISADGAQLWIVADDTSFINIMEGMLNYYQNQEIAKDFIPKTVCAYYDETETEHFFRALYIVSEDGDPEVFLVDTGEFRPAVQSRLFPLAPQFAITPPLAHLCYLADVEQTDDKKIENRRTEFLEQYLGKRYQVKLAEEFNDDGSLRVYVFLEDGNTINQLIQAMDSNDPELNNNSKNSIDNESIHSTKINRTKVLTQDDIINNENQPVNIIKSDVNISKDETHEENKIFDDINILDEEIDKDTKTKENTIRKDENNDIRLNEMDLRSDEEMAKELEALENMDLDEMRFNEHENAVEAVTGYSNRDEMDICKHYKGGDGCYKGKLCNKRHVKIHPDGWTLDRVSVHVKCPSPPLPPPGSWHKVKVTHVDETCKLYVHLENRDETMSLSALVDEMSIAASNSGPLKLDPAPGELVSAPFFGNYYRARVIAVHDKIEVFFIDYGNTAVVSRPELRPFSPSWLSLPVRAVPCRLAGVPATNVHEILAELAVDRTMQAQIIARSLDELTVKLLDATGFDVAEQLAVLADVTLQPYEIEHDEQCRVLPA
ncbi:uncharacterized protein LOC125238824 isoform X1 [Leguminivora glycinivorella]|uniref:uncharacterized protein LOC125238824 isoform X1 n=1 Tax=Leguminivora glycinivorella TaxID=1035111 RepID=UPI00200CF3BB|nr:uncharacterized protein LOC125238824 isoform X1 [Leguminivora glycinivorella]